MKEYKQRKTLKKKNTSVQAKAWAYEQYARCNNKTLPKKRRANSITKDQLKDPPLLGRHIYHIISFLIFMLKNL